MPDFGSLVNERGEYPDKHVKKNLDGIEQFPEAPEPDSMVDLVDGEVRFTERTAESGSRSYSAFNVVLMPGVGGRSGTPVRLVGTDPGRARVAISNTSPDAVVYIGQADQISQGPGFPIPPGQLFTPEVQGAIFACLPAGAVPESGSVEVGVWVEADH